MREEYDFSGGVKNPYAKLLKDRITIDLDGDTADYLKKQSAITGIPYQTLICLYLSDCARAERSLRIE